MIAGDQSPAGQGCGNDRKVHGQALAFRTEACRIWACQRLVWTCQTPDGRARACRGAPAPRTQCAIAKAAWGQGPGSARRLRDGAGQGDPGADSKGDCRPDARRRVCSKRACCRPAWGRTLGPAQPLSSIPDAPVAALTYALAQALKAAPRGRPSSRQDAQGHDWRLDQGLCQPRDGTPHRQVGTAGRACRRQRSACGENRPLHPVRQNDPHRAEPYLGGWGGPGHNPGHSGPACRRGRRSGLRAEQGAESLCGLPPWVAVWRS